MPRKSAADRFVLERQVAAGAMGAVYKAWDRHTRTHVAVKLLHPENPQQLQRFEREAELLSTLSHSAIVRHVAHGSNPAGERFLVMEWLEGETLEERLARTDLSPSESVLLVERVLEGCAAAHQAGIVHRDIKPANLLLVHHEVDTVKIADFGIARRLADMQRLTLPGVVIGTPLYMSPEQARGDFVTDARTDVFSLGCVLFECLTGQPPFVGSSLMAILAKIVLESPASIRDLRPHLPKSLDAVVAQMLIKESSARPEAATLVGQLRAIRQELAQLGEVAPVSGARRAESIPSVQALGKRGEQRVICVVLVAGLPPAPAREPGITSREAATVDAPAPGRMAPRRVLEALVPFGARLDQLLDGSMIISLSGSLTPANQALQAARCAIILRSLMPDSPMALCTGRAVLGGQLPIGAVIDHGVRILESSERGAVRVDEATATLLQGRFTMRGADDRPELHHELADDESTHTLLGKVTRCVGRERDLSILERTFADCVAESRAQAVLVTAPAGGGKSRVRREFLKRLQEQDVEFQLLSGRADSMHSGSPYGLLAPALRKLAGIENGDLLDVKRDKVRRHLGARLPSESVSRVAEFLGELMGVPFQASSSSALAARQEPRVMADQILAAWLDWLEGECEANPVVIVLEDLQWGDLPSVQLLDAALRALDAQPLMVVAFAGVEVEQRFPGLFQQRNLLTMRLGRLSHKASEKLVSEALGERISAKKRAWIVQRADGNPFYLEQLIIAVAAGSAESELPDTVLGMVQARVDGLGDHGKRVLRAASVFGEMFQEAGVRALLGGEHCVVAVEHCLPVLLQQEIIESKGDPRDGHMVFRSALMRDAAYAMLTEQDRSLGHRLAGEWLEARGDVAPLVLAEHFERGQQPTRATGYYRRAAEKALEANDLALAISCADRGLLCGASGDMLGNLLLLRAEGYRNRGSLRQAEVDSREAMRSLAPASSSWYRAAETFVAAVGPRGDTEAAEACGRDMLRNARDIDLDPPRIIALAGAVGNLMLIGHTPLASEIVEHVRTHAGTRAAERTSGHLRAIEAHIALSQEGDLSSFLRHTRIALASFQSAGDLRTASWQQVNLGFALIELGVHAEAKAVLEDATAAADRIGIDPISASARQNLGLAQLLRGSLDEAEFMLNEAIELFRPQGDLRQEGTCRMYLSRTMVAAGRHRDAIHEAEKAIALFANLPRYRIVALATLAHACLAARKLKEAQAAAVSAMELLGSTGSVDEGEAFVRLVHVRALQAAGDLEQAWTALCTAQQRVLECAEKISEQALRRSFLHNVVENRETLELAASWTEKGQRASGRFPASKR